MDLIVKKKKFFAVLLFFNMLLITVGCGHETGKEPISEDQVLVAEYMQILPEESLLEMTYLLSDHYVYMTGIRQGADGSGVETVIWRMGQDQESQEQIAVYPDEKLLQWCISADGQLAMISYRISQSGGTEREYLLRLLEEETLIEQICTLEVESADLSYGTMAVREGEAAVVDSTARSIIFFDSVTGEQKNVISIEESPYYLAYQKDKLTGVTTGGALYLYNGKTGSREKKAERLYDEAGRINSCAIYEKEVLLATDSGLVSVTLKDLTGTQVADFAEYDILLGDGFAVRKDTEAGEYQILTWYSQGGYAEIYRLHAVPEEEAESLQKEVILLSTYVRDSDLQAAVTAFNKTSDKYRIEIEWGEEIGSGYWNTTAAELMTGGGPDLFCVSQQLNFTDYVRQGLLEDLTPYIEANLNPEDYIESALYAYRQGESVYGLESGFSLSTLITKKSLFAEEGEVLDTVPDSCLSFADLEATAAAHPQIKAFRENADAMEVLRDCAAFGGIDYNDYETLARMLVFAKQYGTGLQPGEKAVLGENVLTALVNVNSPLQWVDMQALYGEDILVAGFPRNDGQGIKHESTAWSINSNSSHKEGAWAFLQFLLSREYQALYRDPVRNGFSVYRDIYERELTAYLEPNGYQLYLPEVGEIITSTTPYYLPASGLQIEAMTKEQIEAVQKITDTSSSYVYTEDYGAWNILYEEAGAYFAGDKSLEDTMETVKSRMDIYLSEWEY